MARDIDCPHCGAEHDIGDHPDHLTDLGPSSRFTFDCSCGATFKVDVDWKPIFYVDKATLKPPAVAT